MRQRRGFRSSQSAADRVAAMRAQFGGMPIQSQPLTDSITLLSGPGGNVVVLNGADGKLMGDTFVQPAWQHLKDALEAIGKAPVKTAIDTHWHFDHSDNNASLRAAGATLVAHVNTKKRMSETHTLAVLNLTFEPSPAGALPQQTFQQTHKISMNGETVSLVHVPPAHTDSDIYIHYEKGNVLQTGDVFFNGMYPYIDDGTGGSVSGMIAGATKLLAVADNNTKIVPGHGAARKQSRPDEISRYAHDGARPATEAEVLRQIRGRSSCRQASQRSRSSLGQRLVQQRRVHPNRLPGALKPRTRNVGSADF